MSFDSPPTLFHLARHTLLMEEALVISALEELPCHLFPELFKGAFTDRHTNVLTAMVSTWPLPCLPVGTLMEEPHLETLKALLDGLNVLVTQTCNSRCKLRVLDLRRNMHHEFWGMKAVSHEDNCSLQIMAQKQPMETCPDPEREKPFKVVTDFELRDASLDEWTIYLLQWVKQRKSSIHLCCRKLHVWDSPFSTVIKILEFVDLNCILELRLSHWRFEFLVDLVPYLEQMNNLHTLMLEGIKNSLNFTAWEEEEDEWQGSFPFQFSNFSCLQNLYLNDIYFIEDSLEEWLSCLMTPLETLSITDCPRLLQSDLECLPHCSNIFKLKHLHMNAILLSDAAPELPGRILEKVTSTLQILELEQCGMRDSHFKALLPALSECSQLLKVNFYHNDISLPVLKELLDHTAKLSQLTQELYPAPLECYEGNTILKDRFKKLCPELLCLLRGKRLPKKVSFATSACLQCSHSCYYYYNQEPNDSCYYHNQETKDCLCQ
ncbi:oogenesin-2-like [Rattus rattus]|uniref:oogenesin-2-like n=1 Tax=Rattus rattus TaxID=10117 RepID=UPI0013F32D9D|nr:oogenesin-2-like [Rattus rattus]